MKKNPQALVALPPEISPEHFSQLTVREQAFVLHPLVMTNVVQAAREVGYSEATATSAAWRMRKQLLYYIRAITNRRMAEQGISLARVERELACIAFANEVDFYDKVDTDNGTDLVAKDPTLLPEDMQRAVRSVSIENLVAPDGTSTQVVSVHLHDKSPALKMLAEMLGGFDPKSREPGDAETRRRQAELFDYMSAEELRQVEKIYADANSRREKAMKSKIADKEAIDGKAKTVS